MLHSLYDCVAEKRLMNALPARLVLVFILGLTFGPVPFAQSSDPLAQLKVCANTTDRDSRIACLEELAIQVRDAQAGAIKATPTQHEPDVADLGPPALKDDLGGERFANKPDLEDAQDRGLITACTQGTDKKWYFYFENGQIWKQVSDRRLRFDECRFVATITKDMFGYKMLIEGHKRKIRISRRK
jgi:hypothetical protein